MSTAGMLDRTLWLGLSSLIGTREEMGAHLDAHLAYMIELEREGTLFASGPFFDNGAPNGNGVTIVRARNSDEAYALLARDPMVRAGVRTFVLHEWHLMEGSLQLTVLASQQRGMVP